MRKHILLHFSLHILDITWDIFYNLYGDNMNENFLVTRISNIIFVGKEEYQEVQTAFRNDLVYHELIFHLNGSANITFNGSLFACKEGTVRFLPKGINKEYIVERISPGDCIDIFFDTDIPISEVAFILHTKDVKLASLFKKIFSLWVAKNEGYYFECISVLYGIFAEMQKKKLYAGASIPEDKARYRIHTGKFFQKENFRADFGRNVWDQRGISQETVS